MTELTPFALWLLISFAEVGHDRTLEKLTGYGSPIVNPHWKRHLNDIRKNFKMIMMGSTALGFALLGWDTWLEQGHFVLWAATNFWLIHELGLSVTRGKPGSFGLVGTSSWVDLSLTWIAKKLKMNDTVKLWFLRSIFTLPALATTIAYTGWPMIPAFMTIGAVTLTE